MSAPAAPPPTGGRVNRSRHTFLVDRRLQLRYTAVLMGGAGLTAVALGLVLFYERTRYHALAELCGGAAGALGPLAYTAWVAAFVVTLVAILGVLGIVLTHRVAGPLVHMRRILEDVAAGRRPVLRDLREGDMLGRFYTHLKRTVVELQRRERLEVAQLEVALQALRAGEQRVALSALEQLADEKRLRAGAAQDEDKPHAPAQP